MLIDRKDNCMQIAIIKKYDNPTQTINKDQNYMKRTKP